MTRLALVALLAFVTASDSLPSQSWILASQSGPTARTKTALAFDAAHSETVLFGGISSSGPLWADTWTWDGTAWQTQAPQTIPVSRLAHSMVYDSARGLVVMFGGYDGSSHLGDTWTWDGQDWQLQTTAGPGPRRDHGMVFDSGRGRVVLFGGYSGATFADTWEYDGAAWSLMPASGPSPRSHPGMAFDSARGVTVLFGGFGIGPAYPDGTWEYDGSTWTLRGNLGPSGRYDHALAFDPLRNETFLMGGRQNSGPMSDSWSWDGTAWAPVTETMPPARTGLSMAYDGARNRTILFGGYDGLAGTYFGGTWERAPAYLATAMTYGTGCGSPALNLAPAPGSRPLLSSAPEVILTNIPSSFALVGIGWSDALVGPFALPFSLAGYGMPGCMLLQSTDVTAPPTYGGPSTGIYQLNLPPLPSLLGVKLFLQGAALAPGFNPGNLISSNAVEWQIGNY